MANSRPDNRATLLLTYEKVQTVDELYHALGDLRNRGCGHLKVCSERESLSYIDAEDVSTPGGAKVVDFYFGVF